MNDVFITFYPIIYQHSFWLLLSEMFHFVFLKGLCLNQDDPLVVLWDREHRVADLGPWNKLLKRQEQLLLLGEIFSMKLFQYLGSEFYRLKIFSSKNLQKSCFYNPKPYLWEVFRSLYFFFLTCKHCWYFLTFSFIVLTNGQT